MADRFPFDATSGYNPYSKPNNLKAVQTHSNRSLNTPAQPSAPREAVNPSFAQSAGSSQRAFSAQPVIAAKPSSSSIAVKQQRQHPTLPTTTTITQQAVAPSPLTQSYVPETQLAASQPSQLSQPETRQDDPHGREVEERRDQRQHHTTQDIQRAQSNDVDEEMDPIPAPPLQPSDYVSHERMIHEDERAAEAWVEGGSQVSHVSQTQRKTLPGAAMEQDVEELIEEIPVQPVVGPEVHQEERPEEPAANEQPTGRGECSINTQDDEPAGETHANLRDSEGGAQVGVGQEFQYGAEHETSGPTRNDVAEPSRVASERLPSSQRDIAQSPPPRSSQAARSLAHVVSRNRIVNALRPGSSRLKSPQSAIAPPLPPGMAIQTKRLPRKDKTDHRQPARIMAMVAAPGTPRSQLQRHSHVYQTPRTPRQGRQRSPSGSVALRNAGEEDYLAIFEDRQRSRTASPVLDMNEEEAQLAKLRQLREERERKIGRLEQEVARIDGERKKVIAAAVKIKVEKDAAKAEVRRLTEKDEARERATKRVMQKALQVIEDGQKELNERRAQAARREYTLRLTPKDLLKELETLDEMRAKVMERIVAQERTVSALRQDTVKINEELNDLRTKEAENANECQKMQQVEKECQALQQSNERQKQTILQSNEELASARSQLYDIGTEMNELRSELKTAQTKIELYERNQPVLEANNRTLQSEFDTLRNDLQEAKSSAAVDKHELENLQKQLESVSKEHQEDTAQLQRQIGDKEQEVDTLQLQLSASKALANDQAQEIDSLQHQLHSAKNDLAEQLATAKSQAVKELLKQADHVRRTGRAIGAQEEELKALMQLYQAWYEGQMAAAIKDRDVKIKRLEVDLGQLRQEIKQRETRLRILEMGGSQIRGRQLLTTASSPSPNASQSMGPPGAQAAHQGDDDSSMLTNDGAPSPMKDEASRASQLPAIPKVKDVRFREPSEEHRVENDINLEAEPVANYDDPPPAPPSHQRKRKRSVNSSGFSFDRPGSEAFYGTSKPVLRKNQGGPQMRGV